MLLVSFLILAVIQAPALAAPLHSPAFPALGQTAALQSIPSGPVTVEGDEIAYDPATGMVTASGNVRFVHPRFRLFADKATYDTRAQLLTAEGSVRLIDAQGREIRATRLVYDVTEAKAVGTSAESVVGVTYFRAQQVEARERLITGTNATVTTCDPARPLYRITAERFEMIPGQELIAHHASLWLGGWRVFTLARYRMSLRPGEHGPRLPRFGYNRDEGLWIEYTYGFGLASFQGDLSVKYGQKSGTFASTRLTSPEGPWRVSLGRTQAQDPDTGALRAFNHAELAYTQSLRFGGLPFSWTAQAAGGWFQETAANLSTTRFDGSLVAFSDTFQLSTRLALNAYTSYRLSYYGTGDQRQILSSGLTFSYQISPVTTASLSYTRLDVRGRTPFLFDSLNSSSIVAVAVHHRPAGFQVSVGFSHDYTLPETLASLGLGAQISPSLFVGVVADYNLVGQFIKDLDYNVEYRCDCLSVSVRYRQMRQELWLDVSLRGVSEPLRLTFQR